ncbi:MAG: hypothetical protein AAF539_13610 [Planctomycetota bacterium]
MTEPELSQQEQEFVARIAAMVVSRIRAMKTTDRQPIDQKKPNPFRPAAISQRAESELIGGVVDASRIESLPLGSIIQLSETAVVTPLARDAAKDRSIELKQFSAKQPDR